MNPKALLAVLGGVAIIGGGLGYGLNQQQKQATAPESALAMGHHSHHPMSHAHSMSIKSEQDYIAQMIPHHQEAVETATLILQNSQRPQMRAFAEEIIAVQSAEINQLQAWLKEWYPQAQPDANYQPMMRDLTQLQGDALDQTFLEDMIVHHQGAVAMSEQLLKGGLAQHQPVSKFAQVVIATQATEIKQMQTWLQDWFGLAQGQSPMNHHQHH